MNQVREEKRKLTFYSCWCWLECLFYLLPSYYSSATKKFILLCQCLFEHIPFAHSTMPTLDRSLFSFFPFLFAPTPSHKRTRDRSYIA